MKILLLGGTTEARRLAAALHPGTEVISSLAGRVPDPALPVGAVRIGGFGGVTGLRSWLHSRRIDAVVDATHPFAATITAHAAAACAESGLPYLVLARPAWDPGGALPVSSNRHAAATITTGGFRRVFLTTGRSSVADFADTNAWFLIRAVTTPDDAVLPARHRLMLSRGPYCYDDEYELLCGHGIDALVTKNSGGQATRSKLDAAAALNIPVVMVQRPPLPAEIEATGTVEEAVAWVGRL